MNDNNSQLNQILQETIDCLVKSFSSKDTNEIKAAEARLKELENNTLEHIKTTLIALFIDSKIHLDIRKSIILYLKNVIKNRIEAKSFQKDQLMELMKMLIDAIISGDLEDILLTNLNICVIDILSSEIMMENPQIIVAFCDLLAKYIINKQDLSVDNLYSTCKPIISLFQLIVSSICTGLNNIFDVIEKQLEGIEYMLKVFKESEKLQTSVETFTSCHTMMRLIMDYLYLSLMKFKKINRIEVILPVYCAKFSMLAVEMIQKMDMNINTNNIVYFTGIRELDTAINSMKTKCLRFLEYLVQKSPQEVTDPVLIAVCYQAVPLVIASLEIITTEKMPYLSEMTIESKDFPDYGYDSLIYQMNLFLSRVLIHEPFITHFIPVAKSFCLDILFPLLSPTKHDFSTLQLDGDAYHRFIYDLINNQKDKHRKTSAALLLTKFSKKYDDFSNFVLSFCLQLLDFGMKEGKEELLIEYPLLRTNLTAKILQYPLESQIYTSLLILNILSKPLVKNSFFRDKLKYIIETHQQKFYNINSIFIKEGLCVTYGQFLNEIYPDEDIGRCFTHISNSFEFLFTQVLQYKEYPGLSSQAINSLVDVISSKDFSLISSNIARKYIKSLLGYFKEIEIENFFDMFVDIVLYLDIEDSLVDLCKEAANRILIEVKSSSNAKKSNEKCNVYINKCLNLLNTVLEKYELYYHNTSDVEIVLDASAMEVCKFEQIVAPIIMYLKNPKRIDFADDLICLLVNIMKSSKHVTELVKAVFPYLYSYIEMQGGMTQELFELLNLVVVSEGGMEFLETGDMMKAFMEIVKYGLQEEEENENSPILASMLGVILLTVKNHCIQDDIFNDLILSILDKLSELDEIYKDKIDALNKHFDVYLYSAFVTCLYAGMINYPYLVLKAINEKNAFNQLIIWTNFIKSLIFYSSVQIQIIIIGISSLLTHQDLVLQLGQVTLKLLSVACGLLARQKDEESCKLKKLMKSQVECNFVDEEDDNDEELNDLWDYSPEKNKLKNRDDDEEEDNDDEDNIDDKLTISMINKGLYPTKKDDEFDIFCKALQFIFKTDEIIYGSWMDVLTDRERELLQEMLHTRRVTLTFDNMKMDVPRRTVKLKKSSDIKKDSSSNNQ